MQTMFFGMHQQHATGAMHDALRLTGSARTEQHVPRVIERQLLERKRSANVGLKHFAPLHKAFGPRVGTTNTDFQSRCRQAICDLGELVATIDVLARVGVFEAADEHHRLDLAETIKHGGNAEIG